MKAERLAPEKEPGDAPLRGWQEQVARISASPYSGVLSLLRREELDNGITIRRLWELVDQVYDSVVGVPRRKSELARRLQTFYDHPVWLIEGIWHASSQDAMADRAAAVDLLCADQPGSVLDHGGGIGAVTRTLASRLPRSEIDLVDVSRFRDFARDFLRDCRNVTVLDRPRGPYAAIISTEVFEHSMDPIGDVACLNALLRPAGILVATWSFDPVVKCHLPSNFFLRGIFDEIIPRLGFRFCEAAGRAQKFAKTRDVRPYDLVVARVCARVIARRRRRRQGGKERQAFA